MSPRDTNNNGVGFDLREAIALSNVSIGTFCSLGSPAAVEVSAAAGLDWVLVDLEHGAGNETDLWYSIATAGLMGVPVIARVESTAPERISRVLDFGAAGVMFPRMDTPEAVTTAVAHTRWPPRGDRGVAKLNRAARYGMNAARKDPLIIVQIESAEAVAAVEQIAPIEGVDALFIGPSDLSTDLGISSSLSVPEFRYAVAAVTQAASANGKAAGILAPTLESALEYRDLGMTFIAVGSDASAISDTMRRIAEGIRS